MDIKQTKRAEIEQFLLGKLKKREIINVVYTNWEMRHLECSNYSMMGKFWYDNVLKLYNMLDKFSWEISYLFPDDLKNCINLS